ncbi:MAG: hypothetical protein AAF845_19580 [Bacteroidota bacterium]
MTSRYAFSLALTLLVVAGGCASAEDAYRDGIEQETAGDYAAAADAYIRALERDPEIDNVAGRLEVAGREAVREHVDAAALAGPEAAADHYLAADGLVRRAAAVGVDLDRPATFDADRDGALDAATVDLIARADLRLGAADFPAVLPLLDRARRYRPTPEQVGQLDGLARTAFLGWAEMDLASGRYRAALGRTESALALGADLPEADRLRDLQLSILSAGTVVAAVFPTEAVYDDLPGGFLRDLDDVLADDIAIAPSPFLALIDPADVRRYLRTDRYRGRDDGRRGPVGDGRRGTSRTAHPRLVADLARDLDADFGVAVEVGPLVETETEGDPRTENARFRRGGGGTTYERRRVRLRADLTAAFVVVDAASGRIVCDEEVDERMTDTFDRATYSGDWRDLDLSRSERAMFLPEAGEQAADRALVRLRDATSAALAARLARCLDRQVP